MRPPRFPQQITERENSERDFGSCVRSQTRRRAGSPHPQLVPSAIRIIPNPGTCAPQLTRDLVASLLTGCSRDSLLKGPTQTLPVRLAVALGVSEQEPRRSRRGHPRWGHLSSKGTSHRLHCILSSGRGRSLQPTVTGSGSHRGTSTRERESPKGFLKLSPEKRARPTPALLCLMTSCSGGFISSVAALPAPLLEFP